MALREPISSPQEQPEPGAAPKRPIIHKMGMGLKRIGRIFRRRRPEDTNPTTGLRVLIVTDAWKPQVNGVVRTLDTLGKHLSHLGNEVRYITPDMFRSVPMPTYPEIRLATGASQRSSMNFTRMRSISRPKVPWALPRAAFAFGAIIPSRRAFTPAFPNMSMRAPAYRFHGGMRSCVGFIHRPLH